MTTSRIISTKFYPPDAMRNNAPAHAEVAQSLAGRARLVWELAHGASAVPGEPPAIAPNPQGSVGVDMSGPPYGPALLLPVAWWSGKSVGGVSPRNALSAVQGAPAAALRPWRVWNRPHAQRLDGNAPLQQLRFMWHGQAGAGTSSIYTIVVVNDTMGRTVTMTTPAINVTTSESYSAGLVPMVAGENMLRVSFVRASGTRTLNVQGITLAVTVKRRHGLTFPG